MIGENSHKNIREMRIANLALSRSRREPADVEMLKKNQQILDLKLSEEQLEHIEGLNMSYKMRHARAMAGKASMRQAIAAKCYDCCCWDRTEVYQCTTFCCPLYRYRPQKKEVSNE